MTGSCGCGLERGALCLQTGSITVTARTRAGRGLGTSNSPAPDLQVSRPQRAGGLCLHCPTGWWQSWDAGWFAVLVPLPCRSPPRPDLHRVTLGASAGVWSLPPTNVQHPLSPVLGFLSVSHPQGLFSFRCQGWEPTPGSPALSQALTPGPEFPFLCSAGEATLPARSEAPVGCGLQQ